MSHSPLDCGQPSLVGRVLRMIAVFTVWLADPDRAAITGSLERRLGRWITLRPSGRAPKRVRSVARAIYRTARVAARSA